MDHSTPTQNSPSPGWSRGKIVLIAFLAIAGFYLVAEHRAHTFAVLPFLLLPACLLMHVFMHGSHGGHRGHGGHGGHGASSSRSTAPVGQPTQPPPPAT